MPTKTTDVAVANLSAAEKYFDHFEAEMHTDTTGNNRVGILDRIPGVWNATTSRYDQRGISYFENAVIGTTYFFRFRVIDKYGNAGVWSAWISEVAGDAIAPASTYTAASSANIGGIILTVTVITPAADIDHYEGYWALASTPAPVTTTLPNLPNSVESSPKWSVSIGMVDTAYFWIRGVDTSGNRQTWASLGGFNSIGAQVPTAPTTAGVPTGLDPSGSGGGYFVFLWTPAVGATNTDQLAYDVQIASDSAFTLNLETFANLSVTELTIRRVNLSRYWRVRAKYPTSAYSAYATYGAPTAIASGVVNLDTDAGDGLTFLRSTVRNSTIESIANSDFKASSALPPPGWQVGGSPFLNANVTLSYDTVTPYVGSQSLKLVATAQTAGITAIKTFSVQPGETYRITAAVKSVSGDPIWVIIRFLNNRNNDLGSYGFAGVTTSATAWTLKSAIGVVGAGATVGIIEAYMFGAFGGTGEVDAIRIAKIRTAFEVAPINSSGIYTGANPLTQNGTTTTINIAASTIQFGDGQVSYNAGSIDPGSYGTWHIYADDPSYTGGAVTYNATATPFTVAAANGRVYFGKIITTTAGGGGGGGGCPRAGTKIEFPDSCIGTMFLVPCSRWTRIRLADGRMLEAVPEHPVYTDRGKVPICDVRCGEEIITSIGMVPVTNVESFTEEGLKVNVVMPAGHLYWANGILSHNAKPLG